ncbi:MAG: hypothetical protein QGG40_15145, partial [Myxococcota bacterium]|nr:hypothetical protein [Myxococcota bacterium]
IYDVGDPPSLESFKGNAPSAGRSKRKTIEERLRESKASRAGSLGEAMGTRGESRPSTGAEMSSGGRKPPRPPVGGPASRAQQFSPGQGKVTPSRKPVGERSPDETGMLEMVPLSQDSDQAEVAQDPSATAFFAIPSPKAERVGVAPDVTQPGPPGAPLPSPGGFGAPPTPPQGLVQPGIGGPPAAPAQPLVQGPVAGYGGGPGVQPGMPGSPFQVNSGQVAPPAAEAGQRVQSNRVYAILFGVFLLVAVAVVLAVWMKPAEDVTDVQASSSSSSASSSQDITGASSRSRRKAVDTAVEEAPPPRSRRSSSSRSSSSSSRSSTSSSSGSSGSSSSAAARAPAVGAGSLRITLQDPSQASKIEIVCPSGFRTRAAFAGGSATVSGVPQESCTVHFKGGAPASFGPVRGGQGLSCNIVGNTAVCQ